MVAFITIQERGVSGWEQDGGEVLDSAHILKAELTQGLPNAQCKLSDSKYVRLCKPCSLCGIYSALLLKHKYRQYINEWA